MNFFPTPVLYFVQCGPGIFVPSAVIPEAVAFFVSHPGQVRNGLGQGAELAFAIFDMFSRQHHSGDVSNVDKDPIDLAIHVPGCRIDKIHVEVLQRALAQVQTDQRFVPHKRFSRSVHAVQQPDISLFRHLRQRFAYGSSHQGFRRSPHQARIVMVHPFECMLRPAQDRDGSRRL